MNLAGAQRSSFRRLGLLLSAGSLAALVVFHLALLVERLRDLSILEPSIAVQWFGAGLLLVFLACLARRGRSLVAGRSALAFWLLVLLLHVVPHVPAPLADGGDLLLVVPSAWVVAGTALLVWGRFADRSLVALRPFAVASHSGGHAAVQAGFVAALFARPPPFHSS